MPIHEDRNQAAVKDRFASKSVRWTWLLVVTAAAAGLLGCREDEGIQHYKAPRAETPMVSMRVAIIKNADQTWFFKLMGPKDVVDDHVAEFDQFLQTIQFTADDKNPVVWKAPDEWEKDAAGNQVYAAYLVGPKLTAAQMTVVKLGGEAGGFLNNVNRWRRQLGLKPVTEEALDDVKKVTINNREVTIVQLSASGRFHKTQAPLLPQGPGPLEPEIKIDTPEGWKKMDQPPQFAVAGFRIEEGKENAQVSVSQLPPQPMLENANRWRAQVGLGPVDAAQLKDLAQPFDVGDGKADYLDMTGKQDRILVILVHKGQTDWIFKMKGSPELVGKQKPALEKLVRSVRF
jgi:hypothetical protein